jgi:hypothetical protein
MWAWWSAFCSIHSQRRGFQLLEGLGLVRFCPISGQIQSSRASSMMAWWSVFCSIHSQRWGLLISAWRFVLTDFRTGSAGQGIIDVGLVVGVLLDL